MKVIFFGTPTISANILEYLLKKNINIIAVVTKPDKGRGRSQKISPSPVKIMADQYGIPVYQPLKARDPEFIKILKCLNADIFAVAAYSEIFNEELLKLPPKGCINVHASILPKYRGAAPIERCVMAGEKESGITIMKMVKELDAGEMYKIVKTPISDEMTSGQLYQTLSILGGEALYEVILQLEKGSASPEEQEHSKATYANKLTTSDAQINWNLPAEVIHNHIRGLTPKPGAWCIVEINGEKKRLIVKKTSKEMHYSGQPGSILSSEGLVIAGSQGAIRILELQLEGKKSLKTEEFLRGYSKENLKFN